MILQNIHRQLLLHGYAQTRTMAGAGAVYQKEYQGDLYLVLLMEDAGAGIPRTFFQEKQRESADEAYRRWVHGKIYPIALLVTNNLQRTQEAPMAPFPCWYVDSGTNRLIQFENQPGDFLDLRYLVETALDQETMQVQQGQSKRTRRIRFTPVNTTLVAVNVIVFLVLELLGSTMDNFFMYEHGAMLIGEMGDWTQWYRFLTSAFLHFGFAHLAGNMLVLLYLGDNLEKALGGFRYLIFYLGCAVGANVISCVWYFHTGMTNVLSAGASGAVIGVAGGLIVAVIRNRGHLEDLSTLQLIVMVGYTLYQGVTSLSGVNNSAHIGGLLVGVLMALLLYRKKKYV